MTRLFHIICFYTIVQLFMRCNGRYVFSNCAKSFCTFLSMGKRGARPAGAHAQARAKSLRWRRKRHTLADRRPQRAHRYSLAARRPPPTARRSPLATRHLPSLGAFVCSIQSVEGHKGQAAMPRTPLLALVVACIALEASPAPAHVASTQYLPFYGGGKGQYLEVQRDTKGFVVSEKIVAEESISSENILKNNGDSLLYKVFATNLMSLRNLSGTTLQLLTLGRKTGTLSNNNKARFRTQLASLAEAASNTVKLLEDIGENVDVLFKANATLLRRYDDGYEDEDTSDEGVGFEPPDHEEESVLGEGRIAEAKPIGLAVIGESGLAAARPFGTAVATSGVALARPIGTAIAGIDPTLLGINFQINSHSRQSSKNRKNKKP